MEKVEPLELGVVLQNRFVVEAVIGRGGFSLVYRVLDLLQDDQAVLKELAPSETRRRGSLMDLGLHSHRLRRKFVEEAALQNRLHIEGLLPIRAWFEENGTAYFVSDLLVGAVTLQDLLRTEGPLQEDGALDLFFQLMETVEQIHGKGVLHRDIKPSNVLVMPDGGLRLIDFGAAREWANDSSQTHTVMVTSGFAPPEQFSEKARRGPATDIYALCATLYNMLTGRPPIDSMERVAGARLDLPGQGPVWRALEKGLALNMLERPQSISELRKLLELTEGEASRTLLHGLDEAIFKSDRFVLERRGCPACGSVLDEVKPLRKGACPVCRDGMVRKRDIHERACPACRIGTLHRRSNRARPFTCPQCGIGVLQYQRESLLSRVESASCPRCGPVGNLRAGEFTLAQNILPTPQMTRSETVWWCDGCGAQLDELSDGRWRLVSPPPTSFERLYPEEWARVAAGLDPGAGNAECLTCCADFYHEGNTLTLLSAPHDPHGFAAEYLGRRVACEDVRWLAVGKSSPKPGLVCEECRTEFDKDGSLLLLVHSNNRILSRAAGESRSLEDWQRIAARLPQRDGIPALRESMPEALRRGYVSGQIGFDNNPEHLWRGPAVRDSGQEGTLIVNTTEMSFGGLLRKWRRPVSELETCQCEGDLLVLRFFDGQEEFEIHPLEFSAQLTSGVVTVTLTSEELRKRLDAAIPQTPVSVE